MKFCHSITLRVFVLPEENDDQILSTLQQLIPLDLTKEQITITTIHATGADEKRIILIHEVTLEKDRHINEFLKHLFTHLSQEQKSMLLRQENRLDEQLNFYLRLDKHKLHEGVYG